MTSLADLYEQHAQECTKDAERIDIPAHRVMLLQMALDWLQDAAALRASTFNPSGSERVSLQLTNLRSRGAGRWEFLSP